MRNYKNILFIFIFILSLFMSSCNNRNSNYRNYEKTPVDKLVVALANESDYSIILSDMDSRDNAYYHKYQTIIEKADTVDIQNSEWEKVSDIFFNANINNLGMAIVSKTDGQLTKVASPSGYNNFVGNEKYGRWRERNGSSFWEFYGKYAFLSSVFNMVSYPARRSYYDDYRRGGYYGSRPYYGPNGNSYGTKSYTSRGNGKNTSWASKPSSFKNTVRSNVSRSAKQSKSRVSRNNSRYNSRRSSRSRSGGYGK